MKGSASPLVRKYDEWSSMKSYDRIEAFYVYGRGFLANQ